MATVPVWLGPTVPLSEWKFAGNRTVRQQFRQRFHLFWMDQHENFIDVQLDVGVLQPSDDVFSHEIVVIAVDLHKRPRNYDESQMDQRSKLGTKQFRFGQTESQASLVHLK